MCTVTLEYKNTALARRKIAALLATGLFVQKAMEKDSPVEPETLEEHRQLRDAAVYTSHRNMERFIEKYT